MKNDEFLYTEKYRPQTIDECILPESMKAIFRAFVAKGEIPHMILSGSHGVGKTTVAQAMCHELGCDNIVINGSSESGIDVLRTKMTSFASSVSLNGKPKVIIVDEADGLNPNSIQPALRNFLEQYASNCRFIFTCNYANKIIAPLHSRCTKIEFVLEKADKPAMAAKFMKRVVVILKAEGIEFDQKVVAEVVMKYFPDYRRVLNELQKHAVSGTIDTSVLATVKHTDVKELIDAIRDKNFKIARQWVANNVDNDPGPIFRRLFDVLTDQVNEVPQMILMLNDYQEKSYFVPDQELNMCACVVELMASVSFKG